MRKSITILLAGSLFVSCADKAPGRGRTVEIQDTALHIQMAAIDSEWTEIKNGELGMQISMPYADTNNFTHLKLYSCAKCILNAQVAKALRKAAVMANKRQMSLILFDCYRPYSVQQTMYKQVNDERYVAKPGKGSMHNKGRAVDLTLCDSKGIALDMGCAFDDFSEKAAMDCVKISEEQKANRRELKRIMNAAGFTHYPPEWWHFNMGNADAKIFNFPIPCE